MAEEQPQQTQTESKKPKIKSLLVGAFVLIDLIVMAGGAFWIYGNTIGYETAKMREDQALAQLIEEREKKAAEAVLYMMDPFSVNLLGTPQRQLTVEMHLEMLDGEGFEEVVTLGAESRDAIMKLLSAKSYGDVESIQGKLFLKDQIATTVNKSLKRGVVKDIFFSQFIVE